MAISIVNQEYASFGDVPDAVAIGQESHGGVSMKVYSQECEGMKQAGKPGWYHVGVDVVDDVTGEVIDTIPFTKDIDGNEGHYTQDQVVAAFNMIVEQYHMAYQSALIAHNESEVNHEGWVNGFRQIANIRNMQAGISSLIMGLLAEDDGGNAFIAALEAMLND